MKYINLGSTSLKVPVIAAGCMRHSSKSAGEMAEFIHDALDVGVNFFDHADIYGAGKSEEVFGEALKSDSSLKREDLIIQSKCGIISGKYYDLSEEHIIESVNGSLSRLNTEYLDVLLLHRPDALTEPEEVASAFEKLEKSGKVRYFGVSNHKPMQIELLKKYVKQPLAANQLQLSIPVSNMIANGMEVNMTSAGSSDRDGSVLDYSRLNDMTIQAWSPFQKPEWKGCFIGADDYKELNLLLNELAEKYSAAPAVISAAWILRHPAGMQVIAGTASGSHLKDLAAAADITLSREEWYKLYLSAGHILP